MTHALRRYTSNRGSALFMVISTMTALMIACVAMYFSVISSRTTEYATFYQQQSYQSASSISDMIIAGLNDRTLASGDNDLFAVMKDLQPGDSISTGVNDFINSFATDGVLSEEEAERLAQLGAYSVDITRLPDESVDGVSNRTYDISVISKVSGASEAMHTYVYLASEKPSYPTVDMDVFASTGYVPNDSYLDGGSYVTDVFYDTEFTFLNMLAHNGQQRFIGDMRAGGSVIADGYMLATHTYDTGDFGKYTRPTSWYVRGDFTNNFSGGMQLHPGSKVMVGGDYSHIGGGAGMSLVEGSGYIDVYILGDLNITNGANYSNIRFHVNGDINVDNKGYPSVTNCQVFCNGSLNLNGFDIWNEANIRSLFNPSPWNGNPAAVMTVDEVVKELVKETKSKTFSKWEVDDSTVGASEITIKLNNFNYDIEGVPAEKTTFVIAYPGSESVGIADEVTTGGTIVGFQGSDTGWLSKAIIIDTGDSEDNVMTLRASAYLDLDGKDGPETFSWTRNPTATNLSILVKGRGQLIIDVPDGVSYQSTSRSVFMHYSWFMTLGGTKTARTMQAYQKGSWQTVNSAIYDSGSILGSYNVATSTLDLIHDKCTEECSYCKDKYSLVRTEKVCGYCKDQISKGTLDLEEEDVYMIDIVCEHHGRIKTFCPNKDCKSRVNSEPGDYPTTVPTKTDPADKTWSGKTGLCSRRFDRTEYMKQYRTRNDVLEEIKYTKVNDDGTKTREIIYPKVDIFIVCAGESSDLRFGTPINGGEMLFNTFYGFIYAPYMSIKSIGGEGRAFRIMGAMVVSDYIFQSGLPVTSCYPEKMPSDFTGGEELEGIPKNWKLDFASR